MGARITFRDEGACGRAPYTNEFAMEKRSCALAASCGVIARLLGTQRSYSIATARIWSHGVAALRSLGSNTHLKGATQDMEPRLLVRWVLIVLLGLCFALSGITVAGEDEGEKAPGVGPFRRGDANADGRVSSQKCAPVAASDEARF